MIFILNNTNELRIWSFENSRVRTLEIEGKPYFVGKDVAEVLGYAKPRNAIAKHIDDEDKKDAPIQGDLGGIQQMTLINESGLYSLILSSKLPNAKKFKRWVTSEVLPSIRRTGLYATDELIANPDLAIKAFTALKEERERNKTLTRTIAVQNQQIAELKPKASYYDIILNCKDLVPITVIAKDYGKSAIWLNEFLHKLKIQFKQGKSGQSIWLLYQKYAENGYISTKTSYYTNSNGEKHIKTHTYWTQKGRLFIYETLKKEGVYPLIEQ